jgi:hypothetical protein
MKMSAITPFYERPSQPKRCFTAVSSPNRRADEVPCGCPGSARILLLGAGLSWRPRGTPIQKYLSPLYNSMLI